MPLPMVLNICQFKRNGEMEYGEFQELSNGEGVCMIPSVDDPEEVVFVRDAAGHVPDGITDFMLTPFHVRLTMCTTDTLRSRRRSRNV